LLASYPTALTDVPFSFINLNQDFRMVTTSDIWCIARAVISQHCEHAELHAAQRADALLAEGELEGYRMWKGVLAAIIAIQQPKPSHGERVN